MRCLPALLALVATGPLLAQERSALEKLCPLQIGNTWTYRVSNQEERFVIKAIREEMVGDQNCVVLEATVKDKVVATEHVAITKEGLVRFRADKEDVDPPLCVLKWPLPRKGGWIGEYHLGPRLAAAGFWTTPAADVTVPAGKFKATAVHGTVREGTTILGSTSAWYAEGVGMVKQTVSQGPGRPLTLELEKFEKGEK
jgi:hypothetical protein